MPVHRRPTRRCPLIGWNGNTSKKSWSRTRETFRRPRAHCACTAVPCSASWPSVQSRPEVRDPPLRHWPRAAHLSRSCVRLSYTLASAAVRSARFRRRPSCVFVCAAISAAARQNLRVCAAARAKRWKSAPIPSQSQKSRGAGEFRRCSCFIPRADRRAPYRPPARGRGPGRPVAWRAIRAGPVTI